MCNVTVGISGTGGGFERFCRDEIDLSDASRPMKTSEAVKCKETNIGWLARVHGRQRRAHGRRQQGEHVGDLPDRRRS